MSKINAVRLINVNYNNNAIRISDECFHFHGESTLISLRNGGGKSVLVQMITAPFVHKRYRDAKDRPFESYFTTAKPSFILVEWALDQGAGYVLTGMMVRRSQEPDSEEALDMINIVSEYREPCIQDIHHLPVVEKGAKEMVLKNFTSCRQLFESYKKDSSMRFFYYDMANPAQTRQYFDKMAEYQINYKEWESIIKKVNLKESGLSELFADCRDEKGLVEKWFLDAVESKLNREKSRMKEFQKLLEKYVALYQNNQSIIRRRDIIRMFREEAAGIEQKGERYFQEEQREQEQMGRLAGFIRELHHLQETAKGEQEQLQAQVEQVLQDIARITYEKLSAEIYRLEEELYFHVSNRDMIGAEQEDLSREQEQIVKRLHLLACAKQQEFVREAMQDLETIRQKISLSHKREEELKPERERLGRRLWGYYRQVCRENGENLQKNGERRSQVSEEIEKEKKKLEELEQSLRQEAARQGGLESRVDVYSTQEERYNREYGTQLARNILGEYEPGTLEILQKDSEKELDGCARSRMQKKKQQEQEQERQKSLERGLETLHDTRLRKEMEREQQSKQKETFDRELDDRKVALQYLNMEETQLFRTEEILQASERKLKELAGIRRNLEKEEDALQKEYRQLTQGKTLELPEALEEELRGMGLPIVYGMEWLKKNGFTEKQNRKLVHSHSFLPYALILSEKELNRLAENAGEVYTSFPIPIVIREQLEETSGKDEKGILKLSGISFYLLFNENLLNEEKLGLLVEEKERQIRKKQEAIGVREKEYEEYSRRQELVRNQSVSQEKYEAVVRSLEELAGELQMLDGQIGAGQEELERLRQELKTLERELTELNRELERLQRRKKDLEQLCRDYEQYEQNREALERCRRAIRRLEEQKILALASQDKLQEQKKTLDMEMNRLELEGERLAQKLRGYQKYGEDQEPDAGSAERKAEVKEKAAEKETAAEIHLTVEELSSLEARYTAITGSLSLELQELERQEAREAKRHEEAAGELEHLRDKYGLKPDAWQGVHYDRKEESHQEVLKEDVERKLERKRGLKEEENKQIAVLEEKKRICGQRMLEECGTEKPLEKSEIQSQDFDARKSSLEYRKRELLNQGKAVEERLQAYEENLTALAQYAEFPEGEPMQWEEDFSAMGRKELRGFQGILLRDYRQIIEEKQRAREGLTQVLNQVARMEAFQDDFYRKPLETMLLLTDNAGQVLRQLSTTLQSFDSLMEKLEVDISLVEKEKQRLVELLEDYVRDVHENLDRIDANSTITIREKPVKMLKIQLPQWEENENLYRIRLQDMVDEVTQKGLAILGRNENVQEYLGTKVTTKNLYDTVIGIGNVQIRLYKIEEQREYPITWAEVARNSGGEGFLSAFVILSSLLYYMRRDETDLFADRNEGKVLLMDNPFAQTNASHLLRPLMDVAKKANTQLICLTGLGGESIYNRFDNIYVLNLIAASLRNGMQYLKADHLRGNEPETMLVSQIEVFEQQELIF